MTLQETFAGGKLLYCEILDPLYLNQCSSCVFLGIFEQDNESYDLYFHYDRLFPTVIARYGDGLSYLSGLPFARPDVSMPLYAAKMLAIDRGLLFNDNSHEY